MSVQHHENNDTVHMINVKRFAEFDFEQNI